MAARALLPLVCCAAAALAQQVPGNGPVGVLGRVRESPASARVNALGALAAVPAPAWEQRAAELQAGAGAGQPTELEQTSELAQVGGMDGLRGRANPLTQVLASVQDYIAKIDQDISSDSAALAHDKAPAAPPRMTFSKAQGLQIVPAGPVPIPAVTAATSAADRQKILDETARRAVERAQVKLHRSKAAPRPKDNWKAASSSVAADLSAAADAIDSLKSFTEGLPSTAEGYQRVKAVASPQSAQMSMAAAKSAAPTAAARATRDDEDEVLNPSDFDGPDPRADALKREQQHALMQHVQDGSRTQLTEAERRATVTAQSLVGNPFDPFDAGDQSLAEGMRDTQKHVEFAKVLRADKQQHHAALRMAQQQEQAAVTGLHQREARTRAAIREREAYQRAQDRKHEKHLAEELAEDKKAEAIALKRKEMHNEIERVEAQMQNEASKRWEALQEARKRAIIKESDMLAQERWAKAKEAERAKEALWQREQRDEKYMARGDLRADGSGRSAETDVRDRWQKEELEGLVKLEDARREAEESIEKRIATEKAEQQSEAKREDKVMAESLAARKTRLHMEAREHQQVAAWKASVRAEDEAHLKKIEAQQQRDTKLAEQRVAAIQKEGERKSASLKKQEAADVRHGEKVVSAAAKAAQRQVREKAKMIQEEEAFRKQALHEIALEEKHAVAKKEAQLRLEQKARESELAERNAAVAQRTHEEEEALRSAQLRRRQAWEMEHEHEVEKEKKKLQAREAMHLAQEEKIAQRHKADKLKQEQEKRHLEREAVSHERKVAVRVCA